MVTQLVNVPVAKPDNLTSVLGFPHGTRREQIPTSNPLNNIYTTLKNYEKPAQDKNGPSESG